MMCIEKTKKGKGNGRKKEKKNVQLY